MKFESKIEQYITEGTGDAKVWIYGPLAFAFDIEWNTWNALMKRDFQNAAKTHDVKLTIKPSRPLDKLRGKQKAQILNAMEETDIDEEMIEYNSDAPEITLVGLPEDIILVIGAALGGITGIDAMDNIQAMNDIDDLSYYIPDLQKLEI